jgi:hypothetical protein
MACIKLDILNQYYLPADFKISKPKLSTFNFSLSTKKELTSKRSDFLACRAYLFGFNGMEKDPEITGQEGSHYTAAFWEYDTRIARRWNVDPVTRPWESPYAAFANNPIYYTDIEGNSASEFQDGGKNRTKRFERKYYKKQRESNLSPE